MTVTKRLRYEILRRDGHACRYCGAKAPDATLTVDHVVPVALGGGDEASNLVCACAACNSGKAASNPDAPIVDAVADDALRWAAALKQAADVMGADRSRRRVVTDAFLEAWMGHFIPEARQEHRLLELPDDWRSTVERFHDLGLTTEALLDAVRLTMEPTHLPENRLFRYFCGICWRLVRELQDAARAIIATEGDDPA